ncbi:hypothetical protein K461DRAFT_66830 [Myriangium duriaei CBS 260.36]|uniref:Uncharacterized protein n=1 Tax=Myriangium duriaei CBS 260.36 TaxID=1168546 RepID=A0A9P4ISM9_9PEZI|nr:hypothetical protein K461DRAFT_66830 [Myriangium duriaei CBS 260.36]
MTATATPVFVCIQLKLCLHVLIGSKPTPDQVRQANRAELRHWLGNIERWERNWIAKRTQHERRGENAEVEEAERVLRQCRSIKGLILRRLSSSSSRRLR